MTKLFSRLSLKRQSLRTLRFLCLLLSLAAGGGWASIGVDRTPPDVTPSVTGGTYNTWQSVSLLANEPATIYYTQDGSSPTTASAVYSKPIKVYASLALKYFAVDTARNASGIQMQVFVINDTTPPVVSISVASGTYHAAQSVTLGTDEPATIYFTVDGTTPTTASAVYGGPIAVANSLRLRYFSVDGFGNTSAIEASDFVIEYLAPFVPGGVQMRVATSDQIRLGWSRSGDNPGIVAYKIYRDGVLVGTSLLMGFDDVGLAAARTYSYTVAECNGAGECSAQTAPMAMTTMAAPDAVRIIPQVAAGSGRSLAIKSDGSLWAWGGNLGDGSTTGRLFPTLVGTGYVKAAAGYSHSVALKSDGSLWSWGSNEFGQLGDGTTTGRLSPVQIGQGFVAIAAGAGHTLALKADGSLWAWGRNDYGQLGDGSTANRMNPVQIGSGYVEIGAGMVHSLALKLDGSLWSWGNNENGQLGDGTTVNRLSARQIGGSFVALSGGGFHSLALKGDGSLWAWGQNYEGQLGDGTTSDRSLPVQVGSGWVAITAGYSHSAAFKTDGSLWTWGSNSYGQLGDGTKTRRTRPVMMGSGFVTVAAELHTLALKNDGSLWACGNNNSGQVGDGTTLYPNSPVAVQKAGGTGAFNLLRPTLRVTNSGNGAVTSVPGAIACGTACVADFPDASIVTLSAAPDSRYRFAGWQGACSGVGACQLSMDSFQSVSATFVAALPTTLSASSLVFSTRTQGPGAPQSVIFTNTGAAAVSISAINISAEFVQTNDCGESIAAGFSCTVVVNHVPTLPGIRAGTLVIDSSATGSPHRVNLWGLERLPSLAAGFDHSMVLKSDGSLWAWGNNAAGELGDGTGIERDQPVAVAANMLAAAANAVERVGLGLREDGSLWAWGANEIGQLGDGTTTTRIAPVMIGTGYRSMAVGYRRSYGIKDDGSLWAWGANSIGQLGDGSTVNRLNPVPVGADFVALAAYGISSAGIKTDGSLWALGASPHQIGTDFMSVAGGGDHVLALKSDGSLWAWGYNGYGQLGDGTTLGRDLPVQVGSGFVAVSAGYSHSLALKGDGSLWAWGFNMYGQLGDGSTANRASPVQVGTGYIAVAGGGYHTIASKSDGSIWAWGFNDSGQVGDGSTVHRSVPVQILGPGSNIVVADLTVTSGTHGGVRSVPAGIDCGATCSARFAAGTTIALTATPDSGYVFSGWSGACSGISTCVVALGSSKSVSANFVGVIPANVSLSYLAAGYDGTQKSAECQTIPVGLATSVTYSDLGSGTGHSFAGSYGVTCTVTQFGYSGSISGVMVISAPGNAIHLVLGAGWNLGGNGTAAPIDVATVMSDATKVISVWKWLPVSQKWAFYTPTLASQSLADFAASRGYEVLSTIEGGEGFWVNAMAEMALPLPVASLIQSSDFMPAVSDPATPGGPRALPGGWSLIATGDKPTPSQFASALATRYSNPPTAGQVYLTLTTLWTWDASQGAWYFWAPNLVNDGGLTSYLAGKGYRDFTIRPSLPAGTISPTTGFWVNKQ